MPLDKRGYLYTGIEITVPVDPLTASWNVLRRWIPRSCDCPPEQHHADTCWTTPIYAQLVTEHDPVYGNIDDVLNWFYGWGYCNPDNPWCKHQCTIDIRDNRILDPDCFR